MAALAHRCALARRPDLDVGSTVARTIGVTDEAVMTITLTLAVPDEVAAQLAQGGRDLSRAALEAFAVEEFRAGRLTGAQFREWLGLSDGEADRVLQAHQVSSTKTARRVGRPISECVESARASGSTVTLDGGFGADVEDGIRSRQEPWNPPSWD